MPSVRQREDRVLLALTLILVLVGVIMIYSASSVIALQRHDWSAYFMVRQLAWALIGIGLLFGVSRIPMSFWQRMSLPLALLSVVLLAAVLLPGVGYEVNGARRWLRIEGFVFQPSEFAKLAWVLFLAHYMARLPGRVGDFTNGLLPVLGLTGLAVVLILLEPDLGTAVTFSVVALMLLFAGGAKVRHLAVLCLSLLPVLFYLIWGSDYRRERWLTYLDPWRDPSDSGFQIIQSFLAFGSGGAWGAGLGEGRQKLFFLPYPHTDFIYSVIGEELGLVGTFLILCCFVVLVWRGLRVGLRAADPFSQYLAVGISLMIGLGALINLAVVTGLLPTKGLPLPFISYGGSSLVVNLVGIGLLLGISRGRISA